MRILLVHNYYGSTAPSGENRVFEAERQMLERHGETVETCTRHSDEIRGKGAVGLLKGALATVGNPFAAREVARKIREFRPDVVHFHNQFPLVSPLAIRAAHQCGVKVVMTLHNYRTVCAAGTPMRNGKACRDCFACGQNGRTCPTVMPAVRHRCYRGSLLATLPLAINIWLYRKCWARWVDRFIVMSEFQKRIMAECGFPAEKMAVKGNFVRRPPRISSSQSRSGCVFVGRLSDEKGVRTLIEAWRILSRQIADVRLSIVGDGDRRLEYEQMAGGMNIAFLGQKPYDEVMQLLAQAKCVVQPSICWETFGMVVVEGMSVGTPAVVSDVGAFPNVVGDTGIVVGAHDAPQLAEGMRRMLSRQDYAGLSAAAMHRVENLYSEESNYRQLMTVYKS